MSKISDLLPDDYKNMILEEIILESVDILLLREKDITVLTDVITSCKQKKYADLYDIRAFVERGFPIYKFLKSIFYEMEQIENISGAIIDKKVPIKDFSIALQCSFYEIKKNVSFI